MDNIQKLRKELEKWKEICEEDENRKSRTTLAKLDADDHHKMTEKRVHQLLEKSSETRDQLSESMKRYDTESKDLQKENNELMRRIGEIDCKMKECRKTLEKTKKELQVDNELPYKNINYTKEESGDGNLSAIPYTCYILITSPYVLQDGKALLTFEEEEVVQRIIDKGKHKVDIDGDHEEVRAWKVDLGRTVKFEVNMNISNTKINVSNLPTNLPEETLKDKLELTFYKSNVGGGEIESVEYNRHNNTACITYKENGVAQRVLKTAPHLIKAGGTLYEVGTSPVIEEQLNKLQIFSDICQRTVLLTGIKNTTESEEDIKDMVEIHFQKPTNGGDEVECIAFCQRKKWANFEEDMA